MSSVRVQCPNPDCQASFSVAPGEAPRFRRCPQCGSELSGLDGPGLSGSQGTRPAWGQPPPLVGLVEGAMFAGRYTIVRVLGRGGMGAVYLAQDHELARSVALKVPFINGDDSEFVRRFRREARSAARLHHPNICPVYDVGEHDGQPYLTMAYIDGVSLADYLKRRGARLEPDRSVRLVRQLALALQQAHEAGVVHRDLKPGNIMMTREGRPTVMDFGIARCEVAGDSLRTGTGVMMGTPAYMPLEQYRGDPRAIGPRTDVYSLGVILFQLLTGRLPYEGPPAAVLEQILTAPQPPAPSSLQPGLGPALDAACQKAMARNPEDRHGSMRDLAAALDGYLAAATARTSPATEPDTIAQPGPAPIVPPGHRRKWAWYWLVPAGFALLALLGIVIHVVTDHGTVTITGTDPNMEVRVDGKLITIDRLGDPITLRTGPHELLVIRGDLRVTTRSFEVQRGRETPLRVEYTPKQPSRIAKAETPSAPASLEKPTPKPSPSPPATAPPPPPLEPKRPEMSKGVAGEMARPKGDVPKVATAPPTSAKPVPKPSPSPPATAPPPPPLEPKRPEPSKGVAGEMAKPKPKGDVPKVATAPPTSAKPAPRPSPPATSAAAPSGVDGWQGVKAGELKVVSLRKQEFRFHWCPAGTFKMGDSAQEQDQGVGKNQVDVTLPRGFWMLESEVTQGHWQAVMGTTLAWSLASGPEFPVFNVDHAEAEAFVSKLTELLRQDGQLPSGWTIALPTEAQWEYAARAGTNTQYPFGDDKEKLGEYIWSDKNSGRKPHEVQALKPNAWGLHDMLGNVWEWCADLYQPLGFTREAFPAGFRVVRGGGYLDHPWLCRPAKRDAHAPESRTVYLGYRVAAVQK